MIALDAPETLSPDDVSITLKGWCNAEKRPKSVEIRIAGCTLPTAVKDAQYIDACYPELKAVRYECPVDFSELYRNGEARYSRHLFAVVVIVETEFEQRAFEYIVSQEWVDRVFGSAAKPVAKPRTPDHLMVRVGGSRAVDMSFYPTGQTAVAQMHALLQHRGTDFDELQSILDFGCGCGRVLLALYHEGLPGRLYGSDIDKEAVQWCRENFGSAATFDSNEPLPPTRYAGNSFDLVYAISVFTHLPEDNQDAWLAELRRILKPGGLLLTTIHGPRIHGMLPPELEAAVVKKGFFYVGQADEKWPSYLGAKTDGLPDFYRLTYHTFDYVRKHWSNYFEILNIEEQGLNFLHDAVVCRKPMVAGCVSGSGFRAAR
ncbi:MAG: class I SAM-dependent methyltransferase [Candidatus Solibacter sp.]|nr:class I SAM-dependent methyltransferase [Candidatus Solibacter sp.]